MQPKQYVASKADSNANATVVIGAIAGVAAAALLAVGFGANSANVSAGVPSSSTRKVSRDGCTVANMIAITRERLSK